MFFRNSHLSFPLRLGHYVAASEESIRRPGSVVLTKMSLKLFQKMGREVLRVEIHPHRPDAVEPVRFEFDATGRRRYV